MESTLKTHKQKTEFLKLLSGVLDLKVKARRLSFAVIQMQEYNLNLLSTIDDMQFKFNSKVVKEQKCFLEQQVSILEECLDGQQSISNFGNYGIEVSNKISDTLENHFQCSICTGLLDKASIVQCGHLFCNTCISRWMENSDECPYCRGNIEKVINSLSIDNCIKSLQQILIGGTEENGNF